MSRYTIVHGGRSIGRTAATLAADRRPCSVCGSIYQLRADGSIPIHEKAMLSGWVKCRGSDQPPGEFSK